MGIRCHRKMSASVRRFWITPCTSWWRLTIRRFGVPRHLWFVVHIRPRHQVAYPSVATLGVLCNINAGKKPIPYIHLWQIKRVGTDTCITGWSKAYVKLCRCFAIGKSTGRSCLSVNENFDFICFGRPQVTHMMPILVSKDTHALTVNKKRDYCKLLWNQFIHWRR